MCVLKLCFLCSMLLIFSVFIFIILLMLLEVLVCRFGFLVMVRLEIRLGLRQVCCDWFVQSWQVFMLDWLLLMIIGMWFWFWMLWMLMLKLLLMCGLLVVILVIFLMMLLLEVSWKCFRCVWLSVVVEFMLWQLLSRCVLLLFVLLLMWLLVICSVLVMIILLLVCIGVVDFRVIVLVLIWCIVMLLFCSRCCNVWLVDRLLLIVWEVMLCVSDVGYIICMLDWCMQLCSVLFSGCVGILKCSMVVWLLWVFCVSVGGVVLVSLVVSNVMYRWDGCSMWFEWWELNMEEFVR